MDLKIFTENIEGEAINQIYTLAKLDAFKNAKIRIMPDVHAGAGCVIGFTADLGDKIIPNIVGVDIGCGMRVVELGAIDIDYVELDNVIRANIPSGHDVHATGNYKVIEKYVDTLFCDKEIVNPGRIAASLGTLGGGNHFIEIDQDNKGNKYLVIHTGSRNLGKQVAEIYQKLAIDERAGKLDYAQKELELIETLKVEGRQREIQTAIVALKQEYAAKGLHIPKDLCYLEGDRASHYLTDMEICQDFAVENRATIANIICEKMGWEVKGMFESVHNYISAKDNIVRKGAISAYKGQKVIIPMNMRDGCIIGIGKGNDDWNQSAPHGAGRIMSRARAKEEIEIDDYRAAMANIYTTSVSEATLDESPFAYKPMQEIIDHIQDTVDIIDIIKPVYNFKASE